MASRNVLWKQIALDTQLTELLKHTSQINSLNLSVFSVISAQNIFLFSFAFSISLREEKSNVKGLSITGNICVSQTEFGCLKMPRL